MKNKIKIMLFIVVVMIYMGKFFEQIKMQKPVVIHAKITKKSVTSEVGKTSSNKDAIVVDDTTYEVLD